MKIFLAIAMEVELLTLAHKVFELCGNLKYDSPVKWTGAIIRIRSLWYTTLVYESQIWSD